jgi:2-polyprenyl-3-methyl-5-hydroxy-6-metoxy-1,4-benzoquinol methylase
MQPGNSLGNDQAGEKAEESWANNELLNCVDGEVARRWTSEAQFFDRLGEMMERYLSPFSSAQLTRYLVRPRRIYDKEYRFRLLGGLSGKRVLDVGCGEGSNSVLMASAGASVEGVDLSPKLIEIAKRRAELNAVTERARFQCLPIERVQFDDNHFDIIWGDGILHHLIDVLEPTMERLVRWARPGALFMFSEPVNLNPALRRLRLKMPIHTCATPDERPLEAEELALIRRYLPGLRMRHFHFLSRFIRFVLPVGDYESAPWGQRVATDLIQLLDYGLLSSSNLRTLGGMSVMWASLEK